MQIIKVLIQTLIFSSVLGVIAIAASTFVWPIKSDDDESFFDAFEEDEKRLLTEIEETGNDATVQNKENIQVVPECIGDTAV